MKTRSRSFTAPDSDTRSDEAFYAELPDFDLDALSHDELEALLFSEEEGEAPHGFWNLPTVAGLSLITVGIVYLLQEQGLWTGFDLSQVVHVLPVLAGVLIILLGFGVLSWRPRKNRKKKTRKKAKKKLWRKAKEKWSPAFSLGSEAEAGQTALPASHRLTKSRRERKIFGVCGGIAERFNLDPMLVRIAFVIGAIFFGGPPFVIAYLVLAYFLPEPEALSPEERLRIIRES